MSIDADTNPQGIDYELEQIREGAAALGRIAARAEAAAQIHRRAYYDAAHAELTWAGLCNSDDDEPEEKAPLTPDEVNQRIKDAFSQLSKATQAWLRPNPRRPSDPGEKPLADWERDLLAEAGRAAEANQDSDREDAKADEERCVDCGLAGEHSHTLCIERAAQARKTIDEQNDELRTIGIDPPTTDEADDLDQAAAENRCAHCGDAIYLIDGAWKHRPGLRSPHDPEPANLASH